MAQKSTKKQVEEPQQQQATEIIRDVDIAVEKRLVALYTLQRVDSEIDKLLQIRGELPQAIQDLEDEIAGLDTRLANFAAEKKECQDNIAQYDKTIAEHSELMKKYEKDQANVRNSREYVSISKEVEYSGLQIELNEHKKKAAKERIVEIDHHIKAAKELKAQRTADLQAKSDELEGIIAETEQKEERLRAKSQEQEGFIEERYLTAYKRIRQNMRNQLAVVTIDRDACGGCFSKIPHQRQMEICMHKKVIVCENCGRILVDDDIKQQADDIINQ
ncbi:MAG: hypothetical protein HUK17_07315 [Bacteroidales bacterium]|nr:hypothetical protein [Bacteroidales bacterium]